MSEVWTAGAFLTNARSPDGDISREAVGWINHPFALDFRPVIQDEEEGVDPLELQSAWVLTHIPTGWGIIAVMAPLDRAKKVAADYASMGDWGFDTVPAPKSLDKPVRAYMAANFGMLCQPSMTIPPWHRLSAEDLAHRKTPVPA